MKARSYFGFLTPEMITLLGNTKRKITKNENGENTSHLKWLSTKFKNFLYIYC